MNRRRFLSTTGMATGLALGTGLNHRATAADTRSNQQANKNHILLSLKGGMCKDGKTLEEKFSLVKKLGYDGIELDSPGGQNKPEALAASKKTGLPIHGVVDSIHWRACLSDPSAEVRSKGLAGLLTAIKESHQVGGTSVLLVPGVVKGPVTHQQAWERSIAEIRKALPLASRLGIHILIENVWNNFLYDPKGSDNQSADLLAKYLDEINSPWVGSYFDIGNHQRFGKPAEWIRTLGRRIVKLDVKDWGKKNGFCKIGEGDVNWPDVRKALAEIGYHGWATAEVRGGNADRCAEILANMRKHLLGQ